MTADHLHCSKKTTPCDAQTYTTPIASPPQEHPDQQLDLISNSWGSCGCCRWGGLFWAPPVFLSKVDMDVEYVEQCNMMTFNEPVNHVTILNQWAKEMMLEISRWTCLKATRKMDGKWPSVTWLLNARRRLVVANARFQIDIYIYIYSFIDLSMHLFIYIYIYIYKHFFLNLFICLFIY